MFKSFNWRLFIILFLFIFLFTLIFEILFEPSNWREYFTSEKIIQRTIMAAFVAFINGVILKKRFPLKK